MVIAALISFGILLVAWLLAPSEHTTPVVQTSEAASEPELAPATV